ncbi:MAG: hypothetical protein U0414_31325 [Polyangiaceae bacterium]
MKIKLVSIDLELSRRQKRIGLLLGAALVALVASVALALPPKTFKAGESLKAADLNANFAAVDVPSGAVVAFDLPACPTGWSDYAAAGGRTIIGVNPAGGNGLSARALGDTVGTEAHAMTVAEMPPHTHTIYLRAPGSGPNVGYWTHDWTNEIVGAGGDSQPTIGAGFQNFMNAEVQGGGGPFNVMQPSLALRYCRRD